MIERLFDTDQPRTSGGRPPPPPDAPLATRLRPSTIDEFVGQQRLLAPGSTLRRAIEEGRPHSMILHGPPGSGKTTLARLVAAASDAACEEESAVEAGRDHTGVCWTGRNLAKTSHSRDPRPDWAKDQGKQADKPGLTHRARPLYSARFATSGLPLQTCN